MQRSESTTLLTGIDQILPTFSTFFQQTWKKPAIEYILKNHGQVESFTKIGTNGHK
jgi:hypothetical protein